MGKGLPPPPFPRQNHMCTQYIYIYIYIHLLIIGRLFCGLLGFLEKPMEKPKGTTARSLQDWTWKSCCNLVTLKAGQLSLEESGPIFDNRRNVRNRHETERFCTKRGIAPDEVNSKLTSSAIKRPSQGAKESWPFSIGTFKGVCQVGLPWAAPLQLPIGTAVSMWFSLANSPPIKKQTPLKQGGSCCHLWWKHISTPL